MPNIIRSRLNNIDYIKTIMMVTVVFYHALLFFGGSWFTVVEPVQDNLVLYNIAKWMNTFHIQVFTVMSGFLFYYLKKQKNKYNDPKNDIKKRAKRLLVPYFFSCLFWAIPIDCLFSLKSSFSEIIQRYVLMTDPSQMWFLVMLFLVFLFFEFFSDKIKVSLKNLIIIFILTTLFSRIAATLNIRVFQIPKVLQYILYFYFGGFIYVNKNKITLKQTFIMTFASIILYLVYLLLSRSNIGFLHYAAMGVSPIVSILEASSIYYIFTKLIEKGRIKAKSKVFKLLEQNSFGIYLFHQQIVYFTIIFFNGLMPPIVQALLSFIIALFVSLAMSLVLRRNKVTRFMFGL